MNMYRHADAVYGTEILGRRVEVKVVWDRMSALGFWLEIIFSRVWGSALGSADSNPI